MTTLDDAHLLPKYRNYVSAVEKVLKSFESSSEWADLISALAKLNKVLNPKFKLIPKHITIGKRLAQCMHPALPGGVHLKALEVYNSIFKILDAEKLKADLHIYTIGIFPLFVNASMQVRPKLLQLYEDHFLSLNDNLTQCIDGMLLGLLPGMEEGTDYFDRTDTLLENICSKIGEQEFYGALWRCVLSSPAVRLPAVQLILRRFDRKKSTDDQIFIIGSDVDIMVQALCESLRDVSVLTQRSSLDVLVLCCPLSDIPISKSDVCNLLYSALHCMLRRDMSLNRRLYSWLLGYDLTKNKNVYGSEKETYFNAFSKDLLTKAFRQILTNQMAKINNCTLLLKIHLTEELYPLRLLINLLDKAEIGAAIVDDLLVDVFRLLKAASNFAENKQISIRQQYKENELHEMKSAEMLQIVKSSNLLLNAFEPSYLWQFLSELVKSNAEDLKKQESSSDTASFSEICGFINLLLDITNIDSHQETPLLYVPNLLYDVIKSLIELLSKSNATDLGVGLKTCKKLLDLTSPSGCFTEYTINEEKASKSVPDVPDDVHDITQCAYVFYLFFTNFVQYQFNSNKKSIDNCVSLLEIAEVDLDDVQSQSSYKEHGDALVALERITADVLTTSSTTVNKMELIDVYEAICQLLVDFASIPVFCNSQIQTFHQNGGFDASSADVLGFPFWLRCLLWSIIENSLQPSSAYFRVLSASLSTLLDLMSLTEGSSIPEGSTDKKKEPNKNSIVILSPMTSSHVCTLSKKTSFFQTVTKRIWKIFDDTSLTMHYLNATQLLLQFHSSCPDDRCENILLEEMVHFQKDIRIKALSKFCNFWHYTRILYLQNHFAAIRPLKEFKRCLFAVFDLLAFSTHTPHKIRRPFEIDDDGNAIVVSIATAWFQHCLEEGDLIRVLQPLLLVALHPRTHSLSILSHDDSANDVSGISKDPISKQLTDSPTPSNKSFDNYRDDDYVQMIAKEIVDGKQRYGDLVANLTSLNSEASISYEQDLNKQASDLVLDIIDSSISLLKKGKSNQDATGKKSKSKNNVNDFSTVNDPDETTIEQDPYPNLDFLVDSFTDSKRFALQHMLLYQERIEAAQCLYAVRSFHAFLECHAKFFVYTCVTTPLCSEGAKSGLLVQELLSRHTRSMAGKPFYGDTPSRAPNKMILDALLIICMRSIQSWHSYSSSECSHDLRCISISVLTILLSQLSSLLEDTSFTFSNFTLSGSASAKGVSSQQLAPFIQSTLTRYDFTKIILSCLNSTVFALQLLENDDAMSTCTAPSLVSITDRSQLRALKGEAIAFWWSGNHVTRVKSFQLYLVKLVRELISLEHRLFHAKSSKQQSSTEFGETRSRRRPKPDNSFKDVQLTLLKSALKVLRLQHSSDVHSAWLDLVIYSLPYMTEPLPEVVLSLVPQLCRNIEHATSFYTSSNDKESTLNDIPVDYVITLLRSLQSLTHFALFLQNIPPTHASLFQASSVVGTSVPGSANTSGPTAITSAPFSALGSIFNVFTGGNNTSTKTQRSIEEQVLPSNWVDARKAFLRNLPKIVSCLALAMYRAASCGSSDGSYNQEKNSNVNIHPAIVAGDCEAVKQSILQILNPLSLQYGENLICALAIAWEKKGRLGSRSFDTVPNRDLLSEEQGQLLDLICSVRALRCDVTLSLIKGVINQPPELPSVFTSRKKKILYEERLLHFVLVFIQEQTPTSLEDAWPSLASLLKDCLAMAPALPPSATNFGTNSTGSSSTRVTSHCYFFLLYIVSEFVKRVSPFDDKKQQKDLQDICVKCIEGCSAIVDRSLEHGSWLSRRFPSVLVSADSGGSNDSQKRLTAAPDDSNANSTSSDSALSLSKDRPSLPDQAATSTNVHYQSSVQALNIMSQVLANLLDVVYGSEEKDKTLPVLVSVMGNVIPFLRTRSIKNATSFRSATSLLSSISGYQHTRKSWKREVYEVFLSQDFFRLPFDSVLDWGNIVDHLMTHDATTFKDFMARLAITRSTTAGASLNIFSNRELELEQRALLLKRLAFVILSSATSQYQRFLPEIQERLSESLKFNQIPFVQEQVQVLDLIEEELIDLCESSLTLDESESSSKTKATSSSLFTPASSGNASFQERTMAMFLSACKLLDLALSLQDKRLPHFKMFRWSFVKEATDATPDSDMVVRSGRAKTRVVPFTPHCLRIKKLLDRRNPSGSEELLLVSPMRPLLETRRLQSLEQLHPFFNTIVSSDLLLKQHQHLDSNQKTTSSGPDTIQETFETEKHIWRDFLDDMR